MAEFNKKSIIDINDLSVNEINTVLDLAQEYADLNRARKAPHDKLQGLCLINVFFENSTRTLISFELAGKRLGMHTINMGISISSVQKGETLKETIKTLEAMLADVIVIRHSENGIIKMIDDMVDCSVINAGDGTNSHPTQALLDALTIRSQLGKLKDITVAICGDIAHSRVARSNISLLRRMGANVRVIAPKELLPSDIDSWGVEIHNDMDEGIKDCDVIMMLRLQLERMQDTKITDKEEFNKLYGLNHDRLAGAKPDVLLMHPGPINRGVEISNELADDDKRTLINYQVEMGVAVRMACIDLLTRKHQKA
ncbi:MAG: aspartate carbamoyltransferase catalytic subunit [Alphaproteobacteria bacterium]